MAIQKFLVLLLLIVIIEQHRSHAQTTTSKTGWNWDKNYEVNKTEKYSAEKSDEYDDRKRKPSYRNSEDDDDSYKRKPSYKDSGDEYDNEYSSNENEGYKDKYDDDYKPSKSRSSKRKYPDNLGHMNIYIRDSYKNGKKSRPKRHRFPVARYERRRFPSFGPLVSFLPWIPIFADRVTKQTIIYSPTGGVYILPPLINFYGRLISVAELIASGYASLVGTGVPPPPALDIAPLVQPTPVVGPGVPGIDRNTGGFSGGVATQYKSFPPPKYPKVVDGY